MRPPLRPAQTPLSLLMRISGAVAYRYSWGRACSRAAEAQTKHGMVGLVKGLPRLLILNTCWMRSCENSVLRLGLSRRFVRLAGSIHAAKKLLSSLAADVHHIGIISDLVQNRGYRVQLLDMMIGPHVLQL